jgi:hypothetical protein
MKHSILALLIIGCFAVFLASCNTPSSSPSQSPVPSPSQEPSALASPSATAAAFDPNNVSKEMYQLTLDEIKAFVQGLNEIIKKKDYEAWLANLTEEYIAYLSDSKYLAELSQQPALKLRNITLTSLKDYFLYVVVPSREDYNVSDIKFIDQNHITVFVVDKKGNSLALYYLEKIGDVWKIGIPKGR